MKIKIAIALAFFALMPGTASAQSQEDQNACMNDAFTFCNNAIPDRSRVGACLAKNIRRISPACRAVMTRHHGKASPRTKRTKRKAHH
jgi:hypothetical protein